MAARQEAGGLELVKVRERHWWTGIVDELRGIAKEPRGMISLVILGLLILFAFVWPIFDSTAKCVIRSTLLLIASLPARPHGIAFRKPSRMAYDWQTERSESCYSSPTFRKILTRPTRLAIRNCDLARGTDVSPAGLALTIPVRSSLALIVRRECASSAMGWECDMTLPSTG